MIPIEIESNPNCESCDYQVFQDVGPARKIKMMRLVKDGAEKLFWITGMNEQGKLCPAFAQRVADSGGGETCLIYGGRWGVRFKPEEFQHEPWDVKNSRQWGEPFKFYGDETDIIYE